MSIQTLSYEKESINTTTYKAETEEGKIAALLYWLGITEKYVGFDYLTYAILLAKQEPERLCLATKWLYPEIAKHFQTNWQAVERGMRYAIHVIWSMRREQLKQITQCHLEKKPCVSCFIEIVIHCLNMDVDIQQ